MTTRLVIVHDVLGTLFDLTKPKEELKSIFGEQVQDDRLAELIIMDWYHAAQRDFTNLSINQDYKPISACFKAGLPRVLLQAGLIKPELVEKKKIDSKTQSQAGLGLPANEHYSQTIEDGKGNPFGEQVTQRIMGTLSSLKPRPGMVNAFTQIYRDQKKVAKHIRRIDLWGATNGGLALAQKLFTGALGESVPLYTGKEAIDKQERSVSDSNYKLGNGIGIFSCDENQIAKPDPRVYQEIIQRCQIKQNEEDVRLWFVASHTWDLFAAKKAGFKTAWVTYEEFDLCSDIYGKPDIIAKDLEEIAQKILQYESS